MHLVYESRSLRSPFFCLALPSLFLPLSPVRAPPASFIRPLALSFAPSSLSSLPLLPPSRLICFLLSARLLVVAGPQTTEDPPRSVRLLGARPHLGEDATERPWPPSPPECLLAAGQLVCQPAKVLGGVRDAAQRTRLRAGSDWHDNALVFATSKARR